MPNPNPIPNNVPFVKGHDPRRVIPYNAGKTYRTINDKLRELADMVSGAIKLPDGTQTEVTREIMAAHKLLRDASDDNLQPEARRLALTAFWDRLYGKPKETMELQANLNITGRKVTELDEQARAAVLAKIDSGEVYLLPDGTVQDVEFEEIENPESGENDSANKDFTP